MNEELYIPYKLNQLTGDWERVTRFDIAIINQSPFVADYLSEGEVEIFKLNAQQGVYKFEKTFIK